MSQEIQDRIKDVIQKNKVVIFMKGTPEAPMCGFSAQAVSALKEVGATVVGINVLADPAIRQGIKDFTQWPTIPQIFIGGEFVGGSDILTEMFQRGELKSMIEKL